MKKILSKELTVYSNSLFPYIQNTTKVTTKSKFNKVTIGIGGNIGNVEKRFKNLFRMLKSDSRFSIAETSPLLENPPFGYLEQENFINGIIVLRTTLSPIACLNAFQRYEYRFKRTRSFQDAPRTLDIDIIFYNNIKMNTKRLIIPHKGHKDRPSVLIPLRMLTKQKYDKL